MPQRLTSWVHLLVVGSLAFYLVIGGIAWLVFAYEGRAFPESFGTILATIAGGLVGVLTSPGQANGNGEAARQAPDDEGSAS